MADTNELAALLAANARLVALLDRHGYRAAFAASGFASGTIAP